MLPSQFRQQKSFHNSGKFISLTDQTQPFRYFQFFFIPYFYKPKLVILKHIFCTINSQRVIDGTVFSFFLYRFLHTHDRFTITHSIGVLFIFIPPFISSSLVTVRYSCLHKCRVCYVYWHTVITVYEELILSFDIAFQ